MQAHNIYMTDFLDYIISHFYNFAHIFLTMHNFMQTLSISLQAILITIGKLVQRKTRHTKQHSKHATNFQVQWLLQQTMVFIFYIVCNSLRLLIIISRGQHSQITQHPSVQSPYTQLIQIIHINHREMMIFIVLVKQCSLTNHILLFSKEKWINNV